MNFKTAAVIELIFQDLLLNKVDSSIIRYAAVLENLQESSRFLLKIKSKIQTFEVEICIVSFHSNFNELISNKSGGKDSGNIQFVVLDLETNSNGLCKIY